MNFKVFESPKCEKIAELIEKLGLKPIQDTLSKLGDWPVTKSSWNETSWTWQKTVKDLILLGFPTNFIFDFEFDVDEKNTSRRVLLVRFFELFLKLLFEFLKNC